MKNNQGWNEEYNNWKEKHTKREMEDNRLNDTEEQIIEYKAVKINSGNRKKKEMKTV